MRTLLLGTALASLLATAGAAHAACTQTSANGKWDLYLMNSGQCNGTITNGVVQMNCSGQLPGPLTGTLTFKPSCRVTGTVKVSGLPLPIRQATLSLNHEIIEGFLASSPSSSTVSSIFGVRR